MGKGIDYGRGMANIDHTTGIRYGVINLNDLDEWAHESFEPDYGEPTCGHCGGKAHSTDDDNCPDFDENDYCANCEHNHGRRFCGGKEGTAPDHKCHDCDCNEPDFIDWERPRFGCEDYYCPSCRIVFDSSDAYGEEPLGYSMDDGEYVASMDTNDNDIFVIKSPYYTRAAFCSPCAPGACDLSTPCIEGEKTYCFDVSWFSKDRPCMYPIWSVKDDALVYPPTQEGLALMLAMLDGDDLAELALDDYLKETSQE